MYAFFASKSGRDTDALRVIERAAALDPLNPRVFRAKALTLISARRPQDAIEAARKALAMNAQLSGTHGYLGLALVLTGKAAEAKAEFAAEPNLSARLAGLAITERTLGNAAAADAAFAELVRARGDAANYQQAQVLAQKGDVDAALAALERAHAMGDGGMSGIGNDPWLDPLRDQPRFKQLLLQMGLA